MAGICNTCKFFRANAHPGTEKRHHCDALDSPLSEEHSQHNCPECVPVEETSEGSK